jgi:hypothetical protein
MATIWPPPAPGDMVWCHFPELPDPEPGPKPRPALILTVDEQTDGVTVRVAYGTSQRVDRLKAGEFAITRLGHPAAFKLAGLAYDTKFDLKAAVELPWDEPFFKVPPRPEHGQTPRLGTLHPTLMRAAKAAHDAAVHR